jgi:hypothetical protein
VRPKPPEVARHRYWQDRRFRNVILTLDCAALDLIRVAQEGFQVFVGAPEQ